MFINFRHRNFSVGNLYTIAGSVKEVSLEDIFAGALLFVIPIVVVVMLITVFPEVALYLPEKGNLRRQLPVLLSNTLPGCFKKGKEVEITETWVVTLETPGPAERFNIFDVYLFFEEEARANGGGGVSKYGYTMLAHGEEGGLFFWPFPGVRSCQSKKPSARCFQEG